MSKKITAKGYDKDLVAKFDAYCDVMNSGGFHPLELWKLFQATFDIEPDEHTDEYVKERDVIELKLGLLNGTIKESATLKMLLGYNYGISDKQLDDSTTIIKTLNFSVPTKILKKQGGK